MRLASAALAAAVLCSSPAAAQDLCHPASDPASRQYVIGYGSLMQDASRRRTSPQAAPALPVAVAGFRRGWYLQSTGAGPGTTFLAAVPDPRGSLNAVLYEVQGPELASTDRRERSYCRARVRPPSVRLLVPESSSPPDGEVWIYALDSRRAALPNDAFPIVQSYVDLFIGGCLEQEERFALAGFAAQCVRSTAGWSGHWVNDRIYPRRPFIFEPRAREIDELLAAEAARPWSRRHLEGGGSTRMEPTP